ncbi:MAG: 3'-5' exonuclease [Methanomassiliicoccales archaeon]
MVVGDDDQTIYEWRGARPDYILGEFEAIFNNKLLITYTLSHSFRFGPIIAQYAENCIINNHSRKQKSLIAFNPGQSSYVRLIEIKPGRDTDATKEMSDALVNCIRETENVERVVILGRSFLQLNAMQMELLRRCIPHRVEGGSDLNDRKEIRALRSYLDVAFSLDEPLEHAPVNKLYDIYNYPKRFIRKNDMDMAIADLCGPDASGTFRGMLQQLKVSKRFSPREISSLESLVKVLEEAKVKIDENQNAIVVANLIVQRTRYLEQFDDYYGRDKPSLDRKQFVKDYLGNLGLSQVNVEVFLKQKAVVDNTFGAKKSDQVVLTTIHRTKGLEFDYVFIPNCDEGFMPTQANESDVFLKAYDKSGKVKQIRSSDVFDNERRLFYVAITRARKGVIISAKPIPPSEKTDPFDGPSRFLLEVLIKPTRSIMDALTSYAMSQNEETEKKLLEAVQENLRARLAVKNLYQYYLRTMGCTGLSERVQKMVLDAVEKDRQQERSKQTSKMASGTTEKWWDRQ